MSKKILTHFHFCCGLGGGAKGFNESHPRVGNMEAEWQCLGGIDIDAAGLRDFEKLAGVKGTLMDLFTRDQYTRFHGHEPPAGWVEATPDDIRRAAQNDRPDAVFISSPCKGASGLLSEKTSKTPKYQALNELTLRCVWLMCEAWADDPVPLIVFENVPRLATRGRHLLDQIDSLLGGYRYATADTTHDCGEIGELAQSRKRFLKVARHLEKVPPFLYEPEKKTLRPVGDILSRMPLAGDVEAAGPMHRVPALQWKTWVRLAMVEAGKDWRSLNDLAVTDGMLRDYLIVPEGRNGHLGVRKWDEPVGTVTGKNMPTNGAFSVADPRRNSSSEYAQYGVVRMDQHTGAITGGTNPGQGRFSVADPRREGAWGSKYAVTSWSAPSKTVIAGSTTGQSAFAVQDPRPNMHRVKGDHYLTGGHYGVVRWDQHTGAVSAAGQHDNGRWSVADPRIPAAEIAGLPKPDDRMIANIRALDGTWHRPFTTLELAALQSLVEPEEQLELDGLSDQAWRERIGNAVPPSAAKAIADVMGTTLLLAAQGETFMLNTAPIWVRQVAVALSTSY